MLLIKNGRVIDPVTHTDEVMDVLIDGNHIVKTGYDLEAEGAEVIDADGLVVAPGLVDTHVHFRDPGFTYKEVYMCVYQSWCNYIQGRHRDRCCRRCKRRLHDGGMYGEYKAGGG